MWIYVPGLEVSTILTLIWGLAASLPLHPETISQDYHLSLSIILRPYTIIIFSIEVYIILPVTTLWNTFLVSFYYLCVFALCIKFPGKKSPSPSLWIRHCYEAMPQYYLLAAFECFMFALVNCHDLCCLRPESGGLGGGGMGPLPPRNPPL